MHLIRNQIIRGLPIPKKSTKYVARALSHHNSAVPAVIAIRDMLGLAKTAREARNIINRGLIKINGRTVRDYREPIKLFSIFEADKKYRLIYLKTGRFHLEEFSGSERLSKVINKKTLKNEKIQINLYDGTNFISKEKISVGDSVLLDNENKIKEKIPMEKGKKVFIISGRNIGINGKIKNIDGKNAVIILEDSGKEVELNKKHIIVL